MPSDFSAMKTGRVEGLPEFDQAEGMFRRIWDNSWPVLGIMALNFLVGYTDVYVAGLIGPDVQAAVGFISQQYFLLIIVGNALAVGTVALVSRAVGGNHWEGAHQVVRQSFLLALMVGGLLSAVGVGEAEAIVDFFRLPDVVRPISVTYLKIFALALLPNILLILANAVFRAVGRPVTALKIMLLVTALNVGGDFGLVFGWGPLPPLGYPGIAWATAVSMAAGTLVTFLEFLKGFWRPLWSGPWRIQAKVSKELVRLSWPAALLQAAWNAGTMVLYAFLGRLGAESVTAMAAYANGIRLEAVIFLPGFALNMAAAVLVGQSLGAGDVDRARRYGWRMAGLGALTLSVISAFLFGFAPELAALLSDDPGVWRETIRYLRINLAVVPFMIFSIVLGGAMQGAGDTFGVMKIIVGAIWLVRIPLAAVLCFAADLGALGVWIAMVTSMSVQGVLMTWRFALGLWHRGIPAAG